MLKIGDNKLSTESYKGVRDFYPEDMKIQNYIFDVMKKTAISWGYQEYGASILEPSELYKAKSSEEIVNEQTYTFTDRGGREITLRPEMTPTVARMISGKAQELVFPARWFSIPNVFRYEKPQKGRLREHFQFNLDIFGVSDISADTEIILIAQNTMQNFGAKNSDYEIKINSREFLNDLFRKIEIPIEKDKSTLKLLDRKAKMPETEFRKTAKDILGEDTANKLFEMLYYGEALLTMMVEKDSARKLDSLLSILRNQGIDNVSFDATLTRGFDYYTGIVFEIFDTNKDNSRSLFGGGRYDNLTENFIKTNVGAVGFGMGDVTIRDFLETHSLLPTPSLDLDLWLAVAPETDIFGVYALANKLRNLGIKVAIDTSDKKLADQLKNVEKRNSSFVAVIGQNELTSSIFTIRNTKTREEKSGTIVSIAKFIKKI